MRAWVWAWLWTLAVGSRAVGAMGAVAGDGDLLEQALKRAIRDSQSRIESQNPIWPRHDSFADPWVNRSQHYEVRQVRAQWFGRAASESLDQMWPHFVDLFGELPSQTPRFGVDVYPTIQEYNAVGGKIQDSDTAYHSSFSGAFFAKELPGSPVVTYDPRNEETFVRWITHAAAHQYLDAVAPSRRLPSWMEEGLASYLEMFWDPVYGDRHIGRCRELLDQGRALPLSRLTKLGASDWDHLSLLQAGLFVHYLLNVCPDTDDLTGADGKRIDGAFREDLSARLAGRVPGDDELTRLLRDELARLEQEYRDWVRS